MHGSFCIVNGLNGEVINNDHERIVYVTHRWSYQEGITGTDHSRNVVTSLATPLLFLLEKRLGKEG